uniref:Uncharacterized protein n=1 Tax=Romanomermis culicivorax TaxID=13658 RepID=A0A915IYC4_ROMCU
MQKWDAKMINFYDNATSMLHKIVTLAAQQQQLQEQYELQMEEFEEESEKCMEEIEKTSNIRAVTL